MFNSLWFDLNIVFSIFSQFFSSLHFSSLSFPSLPFSSLRFPLKAVFLFTYPSLGGLGLGYLKYFKSSCPRLSVLGYLICPVEHPGVEQRLARLATIDLLDQLCDGCVSDLKVVMEL